MKTSFLSSLLLITNLIIIPSASAVTHNRGENVRIDFQGQKETHIILGKRVELTGELDGDVYVFAQSLISKAVINGDVLGAVGAGLISGKVSGNIRMIGSTITIASNARNATIAAGTLVFNEQSRLEDVFILANRSEFRGATRNIHTLSGRVTLAGAASENVKIRAGQVILDPQTRIEGNLEVASERKPESFDAIDVGGARKFKAEKNKKHLNPLHELIKLFGMLVMASLARSIPSLKSSLREFVPRPRSFLVSIVLLILTPLAALLLALTLIGLPLAITLGLLWTIGLLLAKPFFAMTAAEYLSQYKGWNIHLSLLLTTAAVTLLSHLPFLGPPIGLAVFLFGWASVHHVFKRLINQQLP